MASSDHPDIDLTTHCDCGAVMLAAKGRVVSMFQCACENCQRVSGSGHSSVALLPASAISVTGETKSYARPADSGAIFTRHFCPDCGTTLLAQSSRAAELRILPVGLFAGHNDWFSPNQLIFARSQQQWDLIADHLPRHDAYRDASRK
ncbi:MAG: GFA family protein [Alphaproteobacteria bacterium]|nr:GFA family protein [Alphaproteobacteria bacterium]MBU1559430.1 GFA family protein [Alphaproteobacteria bacterium]MBU2301482.1 GFA family protein [Alphaproteobacteria bacterium]MBU2369366.1 GFA family protein [Alphaproteobacteria bacterium]